MFDSYITMITTFLALNIAFLSSMLREKCRAYLFKCGEIIKDEIDLKISSLQFEADRELEAERLAELNRRMISRRKISHKLVTQKNKLELLRNFELDSIKKEMPAKNLGLSIFDSQDELDELDKKLRGIPNFPHSGFTWAAMFCFFIICISGIFNNDCPESCLCPKDDLIINSALVMLFPLIYIFPCLWRLVKKYILRFRKKGYLVNPFWPILDCFVGLAFAVILQITILDTDSVSIKIQSFLISHNNWFLAISFLIGSITPIIAFIYLYMHL